MRGKEKKSKSFMVNIRKYNNALAFASMNCKLVNQETNGAFCFKIHDQVYHQISSIHPNEKEKPKYCQLYILDSETALKERMNNPQNTDCDPEVKIKLNKFFCHTFYLKHKLLFYFR